MKCKIFCHELRTEVEKRINEYFKAGKVKIIFITQSEEQDPYHLTISVFYEEK